MSINYFCISQKVTIDLLTLNSLPWSTIHCSMTVLCCSTYTTKHIFKNLTRPIFDIPPPWKFVECSNLYPFTFTHFVCDCIPLIFPQCDYIVLFISVFVSVRLLCLLPLFPPHPLYFSIFPMSHSHSKCVFYDGSLVT